MSEAVEKPVQKLIALTRVSLTNESVRTEFSRLTQGVNREARAEMERGLLNQPVL